MKQRDEANGNQDGAAHPCVRVGLSDKRDDGAAESYYVCLIARRADKCTNSDWIVDSCATAYMPLDDSMFRMHGNKVFSGVIIGIYSKLESVGHGSLKLDLTFGVSKHKCKLKQMMHVPNLRNHLSSVSPISDLDCKVIFD